MRGEEDGLGYVYCGGYSYSWGHCPPVSAFAIGMPVMIDCDHGRLLNAHGEGYYCDDCDKWFDVTVQKMPEEKQECAKCGTGAPPRMTLANNTEDRTKIRKANFLVRHDPLCIRAGLKQEELPARKEWLVLTCRECGHGFGTMPCKDAKEGEQ